MKRFLLSVAYDGTDYAGFQVQKDRPTIEGELNSCLKKLLGEEIAVIGASRTDAGVHAKCNVAVFDSETGIPAEKLCFALNALLPEDIRIMESMEVPKDFHPRHTQSRKTYEYRISRGSFCLPTKRRYSCFCFYPLDIARMKQAAALLVGEHDFKSFCAAASDAESTVRTLYEATVEEQGEELVIRVCGNGFLYNMVRIIAGTLMEVGRGRWEPACIKEILEAKDRTKAGPTAPARGLMLAKYEFLSVFGLDTILSL